MKKFPSFLAAFILLSQYWHALAETKPPSSSNNTYLGHEKPSCLSQPRTHENSDAYKKGVEQAQIALQKPYTSPESVWNRDFLTKKSYLRDAIKDFLEGKRGQSVRNIKLSGKKPDEIHKILIDAGFHHERVPLSAYSNDKGRKFWLRDGTKTTNPKDPQVVPMDIYAHPDGGIIRIKPEGVPSPRSLRPQPSATKAVVYNLKSGRDSHHLDTRYRNEAFKVSDEGVPLPKGPSAKVGMRFLLDRKEIAQKKDPDAARDELKGWISTIMGATHIDLSTDFCQCPKEEINLPAKSEENPSKS